MCESLLQLQTTDTLMPAASDEAEPGLKIEAEAEDYGSPFPPLWYKKKIL